MTSLISLLLTVSHSSHTTIFAQPFIQSSTLYYQAESLKLLEDPVSTTTTTEATEVSIPSYIHHVLLRFKEEGTRADLVLGKEIKGPILRVLEETMIGEHKKTILDKGFNKMMDGGLMDELRSCYSLFGKVEGLGEMRDALLGYVKVGQVSNTYQPSRMAKLIRPL